MTKKRDSIEVRRLSDAILSGAQMAESEIGQIAEDPELFVRIRSDVDRHRGLVLPARSSSFARWRMAVQFGTIAVVLLGLGTTLLLFSLSISNAEITNVPAILVDDLESALLEDNAPRPQTRPEAASPRIRKTRTKPRAIEQATSYVNADQDPFVQVAFTGELNGESDRIIRVELPRSSLFAMGLSVPVENEGDKAKADLLLAPDGTVKGVRLAKL